MENQLFQNKYRIKSTRLKQWDYSSNGAYHATICTKKIHGMGFPDFAWQTRFHESIVRNEKHLNAIRKYIINNPLRFELNKNLHLDFDGT